MHTLRMPVLLILSCTSLPFLYVIIFMSRCQVIINIIVVFSQLIGYTENPEVEQWKGYFYATLFFLSTGTYAIFDQQVMFLCRKMSMRIRASMIAAVYKKVNISDFHSCLSRVKINNIIPPQNVILFPWCHWYLVIF